VTVSAVVVNYNARDHLVECVRSLRAEGVDEIVAVDNASHDGSEQALNASDPGVAFFQAGRNLGFGAAANRGVRASSGDFVAIMNPDVVVEPGCLKALVDALERDPGLAIVAPRVVNRDGSVYPSARAFPSLVDAAGHAFLHFVAPHNRFSRRYKLLDWDRATSRDVDWVSGTFLLARRSAFDTLGGFDEAYFMYVEDVDLCWRCWRRGWRVAYEPSGTVIHAIGASSELAPYRMILAHHRSLFRFATRTHTGLHRFLLPFIAAGLALRAGLACLQRAVRRRPHAAP
jgi:N-acetylglucosaminyl-diphospho-decaprenol L-rhamnosyltransferase